MARVYSIVYIGKPYAMLAADILKKKDNDFVVVFVCSYVWYVNAYNGNYCRMCILCIWGTNIWSFGDNGKAANMTKGRVWVRCYMEMDLTYFFYIMLWMQTAKYTYIFGIDLILLFVLYTSLPYDILRI